MTRGLALAGDDPARRPIVAALLTAGSGNLQALAQAHGIDMHRHFLRELERLQPQVVCAIALALDRHPHRQREGAPRQGRR